MEQSDAIKILEEFGMRQVCVSQDAYFMGIQGALVVTGLEIIKAESADSLKMLIKEKFEVFKTSCENHLEFMEQKIKDLK